VKESTHFCYLIIIYRQIIFRNNLILRGPGKFSQVRIFDRKFIRHIVQARLFYLFSMEQRPPRNQLVVPKINQEINEPSYEMVGVKITVTNYGQNNRIFGIFFLVDFLFSSLTTPNVFIVMVLKCTY